MSEYLVATTMQRLTAYRRYREQRGDYWTCEHLERLHWEHLYSLVALDQVLARASNRTASHVRGRVRAPVEAARISLCAYMQVSEALVPLENVSAFFAQHEGHAKLSLTYPEARIFKDAAPCVAVEAYEKTFRGQVLPQTAHACMTMAQRGSYERACSVAADDHWIVFP